jgi:queuine tRNA-ribosyltransferase catalytic subunit
MHMFFNNQRFGCALVDTGQLQLKKKIFATDQRRIDDQCTCFTCRTYTRDYLHMVTYAEEVTACSLLTIHNVKYQVDII